MQIVMGLFAIVMSINACVGVKLLFKLFNAKVTNAIVIENLLDESSEEEVVEKK